MTFHAMERSRRARPAPKDAVGPLRSQHPGSPAQCKPCPQLGRSDPRQPARTTANLAYRAKPSAQAPTFNPKVGGSILHGPPAAEAPPTRFGWNRPAGWARADDGRPNPLSRRVRQTWNGVVGTVMLPPELL
jgi:hypothetical protein